MRHIHVELARREAPVELPAQQGDLPPPAAPIRGPDPGMTAGLRPFGQEELRLQKVYQLSIFSQLGGFSTALEPPTEPPSRSGRVALKRGLEEPQLTPKWPHEEGVSSSRDALEGGVLCGPGPHVGSVISCTLIDHRDTEGSLSPKSPPLSPSHTPARRPAQHNHDRPIPDVWVPLSPNSPPICDPHGQPCDQGLSMGPSPRMGPPPGRDTQTWVPGSPGREGYSNDSPTGKPTSCTDGGSYGILQKPMSPLPTELQEPGEAGLESSPPEGNATQNASSSGLASWEKTPSSRGLRSTPSGPCAAKKKLLSPSDTGESCSEDEGPSTSKRSRLALLAPGLGLASCRGTDAKAAPFWNHLLPSVRDRTRSASDCMRAGRRLKSALRLKSRQLRSGRRTETCRPARADWPSSISRSLLGNFEESILKGRFCPSGRIEGFTAEIGASGSYCPQHATLPVQVTYYDLSEHSAPSPFLGMISLDSLGKKGYSIPKAGTIQVTLFNPNKTVVKMFLVTYNFGDMPANHITFLRQRIFLMPVEEGLEEEREEPREGGATDRKKILCYLIHLRFQSSKSGKIYLHNDIRLLFSRKSIEVDTGIPYELKSFTEVPRNPKYSPRV
ncbi:atos homolog protein B [Osmerus eperlanus]|uniref:atos homolog protein B n=1 Tax=Osmerus eperlanus TaxID=29151 RepID=UPI002E0EE8C1